MVTGDWGRMVLRTLVVAVVPVCVAGFDVLCAQPTTGYRLEAVDLRQRVIWGAECRQPEGGGLAFGGQDQDAEDGRPHTRLLVGGQWQAIHHELRAANPLQPWYGRLWQLRTSVKDLRALIRHIYFEALPVDEESALLQERVTARRAALVEQLDATGEAMAGASADAYARGQIQFARARLERAREAFVPLDGRVDPEEIRQWRQAQIHLELAAEALDAEPPPRAIDCGRPQGDRAAGSPLSGIAYDPQTRLYMIFGGDHLDYLTNDTWLFDPQRRRWRQCHPPGAPPPRANHRLAALGNGKIRMTGGYTYTSNTDYCGGQYADLHDGPWIYDISSGTWSGGRLVAPEKRVYREGPFSPDFYLKGDRPDAASFQQWLSRLPRNRWAVTDPPYRPRLNRDWGTVRIDPDRDLLLRFSGGHSAHGGTDVPHYHLASNRWELPFAVEFPLGQLYSNTSYPRGPNFNGRPWMTGHTYQHYAYDLPTQKLVMAGRPRHFYLYDPDLGDWIGRGPKPAVMSYDSCFYDLTLVSTPHGTLCWGKNGAICLYCGDPAKWTQWDLSGDPLPGACVDSSTIAYDSRRDRVLMVRKRYGKPPFDGQVYSLDMQTRRVRAMSPEGMEHAHLLAYIDRCCYDPEHDLVLFATYLTDRGDHTPTAAYDCQRNRWITLQLEYELGQGSGTNLRRFPHGRSCGIVFDPRRKLIWGTDTNSQVYVLRLDPATADVKPLGGEGHL